MSKQISPKLISLIFSILIVSFVITFYAFSWEEPPDPPPGGGVYPPLHTGSEAQTKTGDLTILGLFQALGSLNLTTGAGSFTGAGPGTGLDSDLVDGYHAADLLAAGGGGGVAPYIFYTPGEYNGSLGGYAGADAKCSAYIPGAKILRLGYYREDVFICESCVYNAYNAFMDGSGQYYGWLDRGDFNCNNWTSSAPGEVGSRGRISAYDGFMRIVKPTAANVPFPPCDASLPVICVVNLY